MLFPFFNRKRRLSKDEKEKMINSIKEDINSTLELSKKKTEKAVKSTERLNIYIAKNPGTAEMIFYATGGAKRNGR